MIRSNSVSETLSIDSQPGMQTCSTAGSHIASHVDCCDCGINWSPMISISAFGFWYEVGYYILFRLKLHLGLTRRSACTTLGFSIQPHDTRRFYGVAFWIA